MPVTARLSRSFYEKLGDETTNELVNWLNAVDTEFRSALRESSDRNWELYRAELARSIADLRTELRAEIATLRTELKVEIAALRAELKGDIAGLRAELKGDIAGLRAEFKEDVGALRSDVLAQLNSQLRWMFTFWITTLFTIVGLKLF